MSKRRILKSPRGFRWIISALVCSCAFSLSAQTYYRVHKDEFAYTAKFLKDYGEFMKYIFVSPEKGVMIDPALSSSSTYMNSIGVSLSEDLETATLEPTDKEANFSLESVGEVKADASAFSVNIAHSTLYLNVVSGTTNKFEYALDPSVAFKMIFDSNDDITFYLKSELKNADVSVVLDVRNESEDIFRLRSGEYSDLNLYQLDLYNWDIDNSDSDVLILTSTPHDIVGGLADTYIQYVLNDGENVTIDDLIKSENMVAIPKFKKGESVSVSIPTKDIVSRADDDNNTLWAIPVVRESATSIIPLGKVVSKTYGEDDIITGVVITPEDAETQEAVYYTLDGRKAAMPLMPGVYVRHIGDKADKVIIR